MNLFLRFILFGTFAAAGVGIAVAVVHLGPLKTRDSSQVRHLKDRPSRALARTSTDGSGSERTLGPVSPLSASRLSASRLSASPRPIYAAAQPLIAQQVADGGEATPEKMFDFVKNLTQLLGNKPALATGQSQSATPAEAPTEAPAKRNTDPLAPRITKVGEGDNHLSINLKEDDIRDVLDFLGRQANLNILASQSVKGSVSATLTNVDVFSALTAILKNAGYGWRREDNFIYVGTPEDFKAGEFASDRIGTRLYRPNYVTAKELEQLIIPLLSATGSVKATSPSKQGIAANGSEAGGDNYSGSEVVVVRDYETVLTLVDDLVVGIDKQPLQVAIEAIILSVKLNDKNSLGVDFELLKNKNNVRLVSGTPVASLADISVTDGGLKFGFLDSSVSAFVDALETIGDAQIIATPRLTCLNRQRAEILIGEQLGYVSTTQTLTATTQSVEFLEVGTQLRLRPFISNDGLIRMEVHPELSTGTVRVEQNFTLPDKEVTQVTTNIMTRDGATIVIGGLIRDELTNTTSQIPLLGSLPLVGPVFRNTTETNERREILVLITPHIVHFPETAYRGDKMAREFHHRHQVYANKMNPLGKGYLGRKYFHAAQRAWHAGNRRKALRLINLSIHFDPRRRDSIGLRSDITSGVTQGDHTDVAPRRVAPLLHPIDGDVIAPWILNDLTSQRSGSQPLLSQTREAGPTAGSVRLNRPMDAGHADAIGHIGPPRDKR